MNNSIYTPVLFLIFNRLDTTKLVFERIRKASPLKLYIASDGPRDNCEGENEKVNSVREFVLKSINWNCEVKTLFCQKNSGCGKAVSQAITWFFENEEMGIILEDDCLPSVSFFNFCQKLLKEYKDNEDIYHITGYNPLTYTNMAQSYYFARIPHVWGWATWRRAWKQYSFDIIDLDNFIKQKKMDAIFNRKFDRYYFLIFFSKMEKHEIDTWDYQWTYTIMKNNGVCINPARNLITNVGFGPDATHTIIDDIKYSQQQRFEIEEIIHQNEIEINVKLMNLINREIYGINLFWYYKTRIKNIIKRIISVKISYPNRQ